MYRKSVNVEPVTTDRYGRTVGIVHVDGKSLGEELVNQALHGFMIGTCKKDMCDKWKQLEESSKTIKNRSLVTG